MFSIWRVLSLSMFPPSKTISLSLSPSICLSIFCSISIFLSVSRSLYLFPYFSAFICLSLSHSLSIHLTIFLPIPPCIYYIYFLKGAMSAKELNNLIPHPIERAMSVVQLRLDRRIVEQRDPHRSWGNDRCSMANN